MIDNQPDHHKTEVPGGRFRWAERGILGVACILVIAVYVFMAHSGPWESLNANAADAYYNLLVQGFCTGQLSLKKEVPPGLAGLADPYDSVANKLYRSRAYGLHDTSYYRGKLYLYFGITPALILFWPVAALTDQYLFNRQAVVFFCSMGFLGSAVLLRALWRRYFSGVNTLIVAACTLALGLTTGVVIMLPRCEVYEVAISCGYMLLMFALGAIWCALREPERSHGWLAIASLLYGLAVAARPTLLFGGLVLLVPVVRAREERRQKALPLLLAAIGPITLVGLGLMAYNFLRFQNPFEFGMHYQLAQERQIELKTFRLGYLWFGLRVYFWEPARWNAQFPFVGTIVVPPLPPGHGKVEAPFGVLTNFPLVWLALAAPLAWRSRLDSTDSTLRWFGIAVAMLFGICALILVMFNGASLRYQLEFLPTLVLLAVMGILGLEQTLADRRGLRRAARCGWGLLLAFSVTFSLLAACEHSSDVRREVGDALAEEGRLPEAVDLYQQALRFKPSSAEVHNNLGYTLARLGNMPAANEHFAEALRLKPGSAEIHNNWGMVLLQSHELGSAVDHFEQALQLRSNYPEACYYLGNALLGLGKVAEAEKQYERALRLNPDYAPAHNNLGAMLARQGRVEEAIGHFETALRLNPEYPDAHNNLGTALFQRGRIEEAIFHFSEALRIRPGFPDAARNLQAAREAQRNLSQPSGAQGVSK